MEKARNQAGLILESGKSERERHAAADAARRLHQVYRTAIGSDHRNVALCQQVTQVNQGLHAARHKMHPGHGLTNEEVEEPIRLSSRCIEEIDGGKRASTRPTIRNDPLGVPSRYRSV